MARDARTDRRIRAREVRVIGPQGEKIGVLPIEQALARAQELGMNLVEVSPMEKPPVCKIMDYGRFKYEQKKKANESKKKQAVVHLKEIKLRPKTEEHDYDFKVKAVRAFLQEGNKARITIMFRGREITHRDIGQRILMEVVEDVRDCGIVEQQPRLEGRQMFMILSPNPKWKPGTPPPPPRKHSIAQAIAGARGPFKPSTPSIPAPAPAAAPSAAPTASATPPGAPAPAATPAPAPAPAAAPVSTPAPAPAQAAPPAQPKH
ncbi:MAG: translation initiation factor IF-3 [Deltaproteobacteria bacterium]|nr:translation initiation factor IF-3 [Deltaproteobacteria bacterium]